MNWVDVVLLVLVAVSAIHGLRLGAAMQVLSFGGFWLGLFLGALLAPSLVGLVHSSLSKAFVALVVLLGVASILGGIGRVLGSRSSVALRRMRLGAADSALGVAVAVVATLLAAWLIASVLVNSRFTGLAQGIHESRIIRAVDSVLPGTPAVFSRIESFLASEGFPVVFSGLPPETAGPVSVPPTTSPIIAAAVASAGPSTVKIVGEGCGVIQEGSGFVVAPDLVVTNAHVVAGIARPEVVDQSGPHATEPIWFDPELDLAVLRVPGLTDPALKVDDGPLLGRGATGAILGYPGGGPFTYRSAGVMAAFEARGYDIYNRNQTTRSIYDLSAVVQPGNSGGPLIYESADRADPLNGEVVGVVFARSTVNPDEGYALATPAVVSDIRQAESDEHAVSTGGCTDS